MKCPRCQASEFRIRQATGVEFFIVLFIRLRKYTCLGCGYCFRAKDRRRYKRGELPAGARVRAN